MTNDTRDCYIYVFQLYLYYLSDTSNYTSTNDQIAIRNCPNRINVASTYSAPSGHYVSRPEFNSFVKHVTHEQIDLDPSGTVQRLSIDSLRYFISLILPTVWHVRSYAMHPTPPTIILIFPIRITGIYIYSKGPLLRIWMYIGLLYAGSTHKSISPMPFRIIWWPKCIILIFYICFLEFRELNWQVNFWCFKS